MGILDRSRWQAKWIFDPVAVVPRDRGREARRSAHNGYRSRPRTRGIGQVVAIDLGALKTVMPCACGPRSLKRVDRRLTFRCGSG